MRVLTDMHQYKLRISHTCPWRTLKLAIAETSKIMGSLTQAKLPVIDLSKENLKPGTSSWLSASEDVVRALEEYGCFVALYDKVPPELHDEIFHASKEMFDLPIETKLRNNSDKLGFGYGEKYPSLPLFETFGIENAATLEGTRNFSNLMWPDGNDTFCGTALELSKLLLQLGNMALRMVFESYGVEKYYDSHIESTRYVMKFMKYRSPQMNETNIGLASHTDKGFLAILDQNQVNGLEIETKDGKWIGFEALPSSFIVIAGDVFMAWSNGRIHSPFHRVIMNGNEARYTFGPVWFMRDTVQTPEELVDEEHPLMFKPFNQYEFLQYCGEEGKKLKCPIKAYCGV